MVGLTWFASVHLLGCIIKGGAWAQTGIGNLKCGGIYYLVTGDNFVKAPLQWKQ